MVSVSPLFSGTGLRKDRIPFEFPDFSRHIEALHDRSRQERGGDARNKAWIWSYAVIMREEGIIICKAGEEFFASVFSGLGWSAAGWGLDMRFSVIRARRCFRTPGRLWGLILPDRGLLPAD